MNSDGEDKANTDTATGFSTAGVPMPGLTLVPSWVTLGSFQKVCDPPFRSEDYNNI